MNTRADLCPICWEPLTSDDFKQDKVIQLAPDEFAHSRCWEDADVPHDAE